ncbi:hypothetical protein ACTFIT_011898 [Dictyostelium discoideum]|uniref:Probable serine/threonine-protein kinase DDB_G0282777 n=1 Tax=Dictyostelium discoideum TaxID=44689 RepID=Y2777_DICDI|nr:RecName: Full=Probable serine/threonine-protein kinase DDB_G0282777 [Dictyostelium discoideum]
MDISGFLKENKESLKDLKEDDINEILEDYEIDNINDPKQKIRFFKQVENTRKRLKIEEKNRMLEEDINRMYEEEKNRMLEEEKKEFLIKVEEEKKEFLTKVEEEKQKLKTEVEDLKSIILTSSTKNGDLKGTTSYSELFKIKNSLKLIEENCEFKDWNIPSGIELKKHVINLDDCNQESTMQSKLDEYFKDFNKKRKLIITNGTKIKINSIISNRYCDYFINQKGFPFEPYWMHMVGDIKKGSISSDTNLDQVLKYIDIIVEKSNHHVLNRPMFGFLMNKTKIKFVKYDIENNKYYITIDYDLRIGFQYLSNIMIYLEQFIRNIPNSLQTILKNHTNDSVEFYYGATSSVFIVNKEFVYKWFNYPYFFQTEVKYLTFIDGIEGTPSIKQQNQTENWIQISPRGQLIKNLEGKPIDISFYTKVFCRNTQKHTSREVIHRDIRLSNLLMDSGGDPLLVDFGFANFTENEEFYQGTMNTASNRIYNILINNRTNHAFSVVESDDLESLVKVYIMENEQAVKRTIKSIPNSEIGLFRTMWEFFNTECFPQYSTLFQQAQNINYEELKNEFIKIDKIKNTTTTSNNNQNHTNIHKNTIANTTSYTNTLETSTTNPNTNTTTSDTNTSTTSTTNTNTTTSNTITA